MQDESNPGPAPTRLRTPHVRVVAIRAAIAFTIAFIPMDAWLGMSSVPMAVGGRVLAALALVGVAVVERRLTARSGHLFLAAMCAVIGAAVCLLVAGMGGSGTLYFSILFCLPLLVTTLAPDRPLAAVANGLAVLAGGLALLLGETHEPMAIVVWALGAVFVTGLAAYGAHLYGRLVASELEAERRRTEAVRRLAASEKRSANADRLATVGRLAAGVAHEINNPLAYVMSNVAWLRSREARSGALAGEVVAVFDQTRDGLARIKEIVGDLRVFARDLPDESSSADVPRALGEAVRLASVRFKSFAEVDVRLPPSLPQVGAQHGRLVQVLVNLLVNAADALEEAGRGRIEVAARVERDAVLIEVADDGPGFPPELLGQAFEPFFTTKSPGKGTGLGLALSREYVDRCGGSLTAANRPGSGAILTIRLPAAASAARAA